MLQAPRRRGDLGAAIVRRTDADVMHLVMQQPFHVGHLVDDPELADLAVVNPLPPFDILLDVVEQIVHWPERPGEPGPVLLCSCACAHRAASRIWYASA